MFRERSCYVMDDAFPRHRPMMSPRFFPRHALASMPSWACLLWPRPHAETPTKILVEVTAPADVRPNELAGLRVQQAGFVCVADGWDRPHHIPRSRIPEPQQTTFADAHDGLAVQREGDPANVTSRDNGQSYSPLPRTSV